MKHSYSASIGPRLRVLRGRMNQAELAGKLGVAQTTYSGWERQSKEPDLATVRAVCRLFSVSADWLLGLSDARASVTSSAACPGCRERDARIDKLLDILGASPKSDHTP